MPGGASLFVACNDMVLHAVRCSRPVQKWAPIVEGKLGAALPWAAGAEMPNADFSLKNRSPSLEHNRGVIASRRGGS